MLGLLFFASSFVISTSLFSPSFLSSRLSCLLCHLSDLISFALCCPVCVIARVLVQSPTVQRLIHSCFASNNSHSSCNISCCSLASISHLSLLKCLQSLYTQCIMVQHSVNISGYILQCLQCLYVSSIPYLCLFFFLFSSAGNGLSYY